MFISFDYSGRIERLKEDFEREILKPTDAVKVHYKIMNGYKYIDAWEKDENGEIIARDLLLTMEKDNSILGL